MWRIIYVVSLYCNHVVTDWTWTKHWILYTHEKPFNFFCNDTNVVWNLIFWSRELLFIIDTYKESSHRHNLFFKSWLMYVIHIQYYMSFLSNIKNLSKDFVHIGVCLHVNTVNRKKIWKIRKQRSAFCVSCK